jgi:HK97 family phage portal protein
MDRLFGKKAALPNVLTGSSIMRMGLPVYDRYNQQQNVDRYATLDDIYSVVRLIAKTAAMVPIRVYKVKDEKKFRQYQATNKQHSYTSRSLVEKMLLKSQSLEEVPQGDQLQMLLDNPNPLYSKSEFLDGFYTMRLICGNSYIYKPTLEEGVNAGKTSEMWLMPPQFTNPVITQTFPKQITGYQLRIFGIVDVPINDVMHSRYYNPQFTVMGDELIGLSPLQPLHRTAQRSKSENDFMVRGFQNAGAQGIVNFEGLEESSTEALGKMKEDYYTDSGGSYNARKSLFHAGKTTFTQIGLGPVDMQVIESQKITFKKICNAYGVSDVLFNNGESSTESNVNEMVKRLYTNAALPEVFAYRDLLNQYLAPAYGQGYYIDADITGITELQDDMKAMAEIFSTLPIMQPNLILEAFKYGKSEDPLMDKYYIKSGYSAIEDMQPVDILPNPANDFNA